MGRTNELAVAALLLAVGCSGCGDDISCPDDTVLVGGACVPDDGDMAIDAGDCVVDDEVCDGEDNDCDGTVDEGIAPVSLFADDDDDGFGGAAIEDCGPKPGVVEVGGDCDDGDADVNPGATESCNGVDDDCNGGVDDGMLRAGTPVPLGIEGFSFTDTFLPYGDGYFFLYYDAPLDQALYFLVDQEGSTTAGPLRITTEPVPLQLVSAVTIDDERVAILWIEEDGGDFDVWGRVLNPADPTMHTDPQLVIPDQEYIPSVAVLNDRLVVWETPPPTVAATTPARAFSYDLAFEDGNGPVMLARPASTPPTLVSFVGAFGAEEAFLSVYNYEGLLTPVDPETLAPAGTAQDALPDLQLADGPIEAFMVAEILGPNYFAAYAETIDPDGSVTTLTETETDLAVSNERGQLGSTHHTGRVVLAMACYEGGADPDGECRYQWVEAGNADPISDALPLTSPTDDLVQYPRLAANGGHAAAIVHNGDFASTPDLYFVPFECPAP